MIFQQTFLAKKWFTEKHYTYDSPWLNLFEPIPITANWLERMGFELVVWNDVIRQYFVPVTKNSRCVLSLKFGEYIGFPDRLDKVTIGTPPFESGSTYGTFPIQYVHQLMNLYYSLTGEELTAKEKV